jgi:hypothetical protein
VCGKLEILSICLRLLALGDGNLAMMRLRGVVAGLAALGAVTVKSAETSAQYNWGGLYIGANAGWAGADYTSQIVPPNQKISVNGTHDSGIVGGHTGIQHQSAGTGMVLGLEAAYSGTGALSGWGNQTAGGTQGCAITTPRNSFQARFDSLFTIGPRLGWSPSQQWLLFVTGGSASAR